MVFCETVTWLRLMLSEVLTTIAVDDRAAALFGVHEILLPVIVVPSPVASIAHSTASVIVFSIVAPTQIAEMPVPLVLEAPRSPRGRSR